MPKVGRKPVVLFFFAIKSPVSIEVARHRYFAVRTMAIRVVEFSSGRGGGVKIRKIFA